MKKNVIILLLTLLIISLYAKKPDGNKVDPLIEDKFKKKFGSAVNGAALLIITANSLFSFLSSYASMNLDWTLLIKFSLGAIMGILIGTKLSMKMPGNYLKKIFGWFILGLSLYIVCKQFFL